MERPFWFVRRNSSSKAGAQLSETRFLLKPESPARSRWPCRARSSRAVNRDVVTHLHTWRRLMYFPAAPKCHSVPMDVPPRTTVRQPSRRQSSDPQEIQLLRDEHTALHQVRCYWRELTPSSRVHRTMKSQSICRSGVLLTPLPNQPFRLLQ